MQEIGNIIAMALNDPAEEKVLAEARNRVAKLCDKYPLY